MVLVLVGHVTLCLQMLDAVLVALAKPLSPFELTRKAINSHHYYVEQETHSGDKVWVTRKGAVGRVSASWASSPARWARARTSSGARATPSRSIPAPIASDR